MELYLQLGYGMMALSRDLVERWRGGTVILSPRDLTEEQIARLGSELSDRHGATLVDPQLYSPRATHERLMEHAYWPRDYGTGALSEGEGLEALFTELLSLNDRARAERLIIPGLCAQRVDHSWLDLQAALVGHAAKVAADRQRLATVCISGEGLLSEDQVGAVVDAAENWEVGGVYVVPARPDGAYFATDPVWLGNLLVLCAGLKRQGKEVVVGYSNQQMLCLGVANVDAIASGRWTNVRQFSLDRFEATDVSQTKRTALWYYCPRALSELKLPVLDLAQRSGALGLLMPGDDCPSDHADLLFSGAQPTTTQYRRRHAHCHYLESLRGQCLAASADTYLEASLAHETLLTRCEALLTQLASYGISGGDRGFERVIGVNRAALRALDDRCGFVLERAW